MVDRSESPSRMSFKSSWSAERPINFEGMDVLDHESRMMDRPESPSRMSLGSNWSAEQKVYCQGMKALDHKSRADTLSCKSAMSDWSAEKTLDFPRMDPTRQRRRSKSKADTHSCKSAMSDWSAEKTLDFPRMDPTRRRRSDSSVVKYRGNDDNRSTLTGSASARDSGRGSIITDPSSDILPQEHIWNPADAESGDTGCDMCQENKLKTHILYLENAQLKKMITEVQHENLSLRKVNETLKQNLGELRLPGYMCRGKTPVAADLILDPDTAHCALSISNDGKRVRVGDKRTVDQSGKRFDKWQCVLARKGFGSGRHYWEVEVNREFTIGVTQQSAQRNGKFTFLPTEGYWCVYHYKQSFTALDDPIKHLQIDSVPRVLGVCIDVDEKWVTFYNTETKAHIYTFSNMVFPDGEKIYPVFNTLRKSEDLVIKTVG